MKAAPPVRVTVGPGGALRGGVASLGALAAGVVAAWVAARLGATEGAAAVATVAVAALGFGFVLVQLRGAPQGLLWNGRTWLLEPVRGQALAGSGDAHVREGRPRVMIDAGVWMLLRFDPATSPRRPSWLAVARAGQRPAWHALRCAVYSPPPPVGPDSVGAAPAAE